MNVDAPHGLALLDDDLCDYFSSILSGHNAQVDHHWPYCRQHRSGEELRRLPKVPVTFDEHTVCHSSNPWALVDLLMERAPRFWEEIGLLGIYGPQYETWLARREYLEAVSCPCVQQGRAVALGVQR